jgi:PRC-barrel domain
MAEPELSPTLEEVNDWTGAEVTEMGGEKVGEVLGCFVDDDSGEPAWLIVRLGRRRRRTRIVAVPLGFCAGAPFGVWVAQEGERLGRAPVVDPARPLLREHELTICAHFGVGEAVGRAAEVVERPEGAVTAAPPRH